MNLLTYPVYAILISLTLSTCFIITGRKGWGGGGIKPQKKSQSQTQWNYQSMKFIASVLHRYSFKTDNNKGFNT